jgi:hypothetical protein
VDGDEAADTLVDALHRLAEHQPMLLARVTAEGSQHVLRLEAPGAVPEPTVYDLRETDPATMATTLREIRAKMSSTGPDPTRGPGLDIRLTLPMAVAGCTPA